MLGIVVAVVAFLALRDPRSSVSAVARTTTVVTTPAATTPHPTSSVPTSARGSAHPTSSGTVRTSASTATGTRAVPLVVLNNTTTGGLAGQAAQRFQAAGWTVTRYGNLPGSITDVVSTCAYYDPAVTGAEAAAKALQQQFPTIKRVRERFAELPAAPVVVVLTPGYVAA